MFPIPSTAYTHRQHNYIEVGYRFSPAVRSWLDAPAEQLTSALLYNTWAVKHSEPLVYISESLLTPENIAYAKAALFGTPAA